jgi:protein disulfide-isomerase
VKVDFPPKAKLPFHESTQNANLKREFAMRGFPTIIAVDAHGKRVAELKGYVRGGPKAFIATLEQQLRRQPASITTEWHAL